MKNIDKKQVVEGAPIVEASDSPAFVFLRKDRALTVKTGASTSLVTPFLIGVGEGGGADDDEGENPGEELDKDVPDLSDIEEVTYEQYFDAFNSIRYNAILKVRNSSTKKNLVIGVDARNTPKSETSDSGTVPASDFVTPTPSTPSVVFDRTGTAVAWGWNNSTGLGSYSSISYEWEIRSTNATSGSTISAGTKTYAASGSLAIGDSGKNRTYRISSGDGDTPATANSRWLRVRAVVVGTNGKTYYSRFSKPI